MNLNAKVIVNADDFGMSESVNRAILQSFDLGIISTTTIMCNMPGFMEACELAHQNKIIDRIGIHLNITEGLPLTEDIKNFPKFYSSGQMYKSFKGHFLNKEESRVVYKEFQAQLNLCRKQGLIPTHADSHHHFHHFWGIGKVVKELAIANNILAVRLRFNWGNISKQRKAYSEFYNLSLKFHGLAKTNYFCEIRSVDKKLLNKKAAIEVMVHPCLNDKNVLTNYNNGDNLINLTNNYLPSKDFITYNSLEN